MVTCPLTGNLNARVLELLRTSEIQCLDLAASMTDEEGLNLDARDILHGIRTLISPLALDISPGTDSNSALEATQLLISYRN